MNKYMMGFLGMALAFSVAPAMAATVQTDQGAPADVSVNIPVNLTIAQWCKAAFRSTNNTSSSFNLVVGPSTDDGSWNGNADASVNLDVTTNFAATLTAAFVPDASVLGTGDNATKVDPKYGTWLAYFGEASDTIKFTTLAIGEGTDTTVTSQNAPVGSPIPVHVSVTGVKNTTPWTRNGSQQSASQYMGTCTVTIAAQ